MDHHVGDGHRGWEDLDLLETTGCESVRTALITLPLSKERGAREREREREMLSIDFFFLGAQCNPGCEELCYLCQYEEDVCFRAS